MVVLPAPAHEPDGEVRQVSGGPVLGQEDVGEMSCTSQGCINLNVQMESRKLAEDREQLASRERSLMRFLVLHGDGQVDGSLLRLVLEPVFDCIEAVFGTVDALARYVSLEPGGEGSLCPYESLMDELGKKLRLYLRIDEGEDWIDEQEIFAKDGFSTMQTLDSLDDLAAGLRSPVSD